MEYNLFYILARVLFIFIIMRFCQIFINNGFKFLAGKELKELFKSKGE